MQQFSSAVVDDVQGAVVRVIVRSATGPPSVGTGFAIDARRVVTAAHTLFDQENLADILPIDLSSRDEKEAFCHRFLLEKQIAVELLTVNGERLVVEECALSGAMDLCVFTVSARQTWLLPGSLSTHILAEEVLMCGFPFTDGVTPVDWPLAAWRGQVMNRLTMTVGGFEPQSFIRLFGCALPGASGAPVLNTAGAFVGLLTGQMSWGSRRLAVFGDEQETGGGPVTRGSLYTPLPYGYMTPVERVMEFIKNPSLATRVFRERF